MHEVHDCDEGGLQLGVAVDEPAEQFLVDMGHELEGLLQLAEGGEAHLGDVLCENHFRDVLRWVVVGIVVVTPSKQPDHFVALEEEVVLT